jgi:uncharacterized sulfatase
MPAIMLRLLASVSKLGSYLVAFSFIYTLACDDRPEPRLTGPPNIVLIIGDDHGYPDFGFMGSPHVATPSLDRLAQQGTVFTHGFAAASVCRPSLRSLLTGLHPVQWEQHIDALAERGVRRPRGEEMQDFVTLPSLLASAGYRSFEGGKFWEVDYRLAGFTDGMETRDGDQRAGGAGSELGRSTMEPLFSFIDEHASAPFFVWFSPKLPHFPHDASAEYEAPYAGRDLSIKAIRYYANVTRFDARVGELLEILEQRGLRENTLVVYLADNGWDQGPRVSSFPGSREAWQRMEGFDGERGKKSMYELGFRTPIILSWPGHVPAGVVRDQLVSAVDLFPTLLDYAQPRAAKPRAAQPRAAALELPPGRPGHSLRPLLEGGADWPRTEVIGAMSKVRMSSKRPADRPAPNYNDREPAYFLRSRDWYYIWREDWGSEELYDVHLDPKQTRDLATERPELTRRLRARIEDWKRERLRPVTLEPGMRR